jgi:predicted enzyme related to lactoylglutathione lyase
MRLHSAVFYTSDIDRIEKFYQDKLEFQVEYRSGDKFISFLIGNSGRLGIKKQKEDREVPGHQSVFIQVDNIKEVYEDIKSTDIEILKPLTEEGWSTNFTILDPDGNKVLFLAENNKKQ